jgi:hypothetical protein
MSDDELVLCLDCGQEVPSSELDLHVSQCEGGEKVVRVTSIADQRLQRSRSRGKFKISAVVIVILLIGIILGAYVSIYHTSLFDSSASDNKNKEFQEAEDQLDAVVIPTGDDDVIDPDTGGDDDTVGDDDIPADDDDEPTTNVTDDDVVDPPLEEVVMVPISDITTTAKWYTYDSDGVEIRFFGVRSNDDEIHVAFDACDVCYEHLMGYVQDGIVMVCNYCEKSFPIKAIGTENKQGGCWPSHMEWTIEDDNIVIKVTDLEEKRYMFE